MSLHLFPTATDAVIDLGNPSHAHISILDIGWSLAQTNRYYGHCVRPYSVAEHSLLVSDILARQGFDAHAQMMGLMHDAHEAYCGDLHPYTKLVLGWAWRNHEATLERAVRSAFWLHTAYHVHHEAVERADKAALACELRDLKDRPEQMTLLSPDQETCHWVQLATAERAARNWEYWRDAFVDRYYELDAARTGLIGGPAHAIRLWRSTAR